MKKDIPFYPVQGIQVAIVRKINEANVPEWSVVLINRNPEPINTVMVTSKGYASAESGTDPAQKTSTLRHFYPEIASETHQVVESIVPEVFHLYNEFWISYFLENQVYDKKFIFVPDSIVEDNIIDIAPFGLQGVLHE
jgi:hypothetical protein